MKSHIREFQFSESWINSINSKGLKYYIIEMIMNFVIFYPLVGVIVAYNCDKDIAFFDVLTMLFSTILMTISLEKITNFKLRFSVQICISIICLIFLYTYNKDMTSSIVVIIYFCVRLLFYFRELTKKELKFKSFAYVIFGQIFLGLTYVTSASLKEYDMKVLIIICSILLVCLSIYYISANRLENFMNSEEQYTFKEVNKVQKINRTIVAGVVLIFIGVFIILHFILVALGVDTLFINFLSFIGLANNSFIQEIIKNDVDSSKNGQTVQSAGNGNSKAQHLSSSAVIFNDIIIFLAISIILILIVGKLILMYKNVRTINTEKLRNMNVDDEEETREKVVVNFEFLKKLVNIKLSSREKVRKEYHKFISTQSKNKFEIENADTPFEIDEKLEGIIDKDINDITKLYEKARYSSEEVSDEDVKTIRKLIQLRKQKLQTEKYT